VALHGEIKINGQVIGAWQARRLETLIDETQVSTYECSVDYVGRGGQMTQERFELRHRYSEGAISLASQVLAHADRQAQ
jgi:hypothetical protein